MVYFLQMSFDKMMLCVSRHFRKTLFPGRSLMQAFIAQIERRTGSSLGISEASIGNGIYLFEKYKIELGPQSFC